MHHIEKNEKNVIGVLITIIFVALLKKLIDSLHRVKREDIEVVAKMPKKWLTIITQSSLIIWDTTYV